MRVINKLGLKAKGVPYGPPHLRRLEEAGKFPARIYLSPSRVAWVESEIDEWLEARAAERVVVKARQREAKLGFSEKLRAMGKKLGRRPGNSKKRKAKQSPRPKGTPTALKSAEAEASTGA